ncbi:hypothetical protein ACROYT_G041113 [Oculina patagonica]
MSAGEREFIFDAVVGFLTSPIWNSPVRTFIEQNSLVFDADGENHEAYQEIHNKYKGMVETLLASFLKDVGISEEQFMTACKDGSASQQFNGINRDVFDQMWAAEDFEVFKRLMIQKNIELQLQALQLLQQIHNVQMPMQMPMPTQMPVPVPAALPSGAPAVAPSMDEDAIMQEVLKRSKEEYESKQKDAKGKTEQELEKTIAESKEENERLREIAKREQEELEKALQISLEAQKKQTAEAEKLRDEVKQSTAKPTPVESKPAPKPSPAASKSAPKPSPAPSKAAPKPAPFESKAAPKPSPAKSKSPTQPEPKTSGLPPLLGQPKKAADKPADAAAGWLKSAKEDAAGGASVTPAQTQEITEEELKRREAYLKQQRDKLLALKQQEREKSLTKYTEQQPKARPTSSRAARRVTAGEQVDSPASKTSEDDGKKLAMRRALADCLKREVIDKN